MRAQDTGRRGTGRARGWVHEVRERSALADAAGLVYERDRSSAGTVLGSAIAFRLFLFFVPMLLLVVGLAGFLDRWADPADVSDTLSVSGALADQIQTALTQPTSTRWVAILTGLVGVMWAGRSLALALVASSSLAWGTGGKVTTRLRVMAAVIGVVVGLLLVSVLINRIREVTGVAVTGLSFGAALVVYVVLSSLLMLSLPRATSDPGAALPGALVVSLMLLGMQLVSQVYLPRQFEGASTLYGGLGVVVVTLGWFFIVGRAMSFAFSVNAAVYERLGSVSGILFSLPLLRALPGRSVAFRDYFGLDERGRSASRSGEQRPTARDDGPPSADPNR